jgi:hypothetical protein
VWRAGCSDFLLSCHARDPAERPTAAALLQHRWIVQNLAAMPAKNYKVVQVGTAPGQEEARAAEIAAADQADRADFADETLCPVLGRPLYDAMHLFPCGDTISEEAYTALGGPAGGAKACPVCRRTIESATPDQLTRRLVARFCETPQFVKGGPPAASKLGQSAAVSEPSDSIDLGMNCMSIDAGHRFD